MTRIDALRSALIEIRDVAAISDGVDWYAMVADRALEEDDVHGEEECSSEEE